MIILLYNKDLINDTYYPRVIKFFLTIKRSLNPKLNSYKKIKNYLHDKCKIYQFDFYNKTKYLNVYYIFSIKIINLKIIKR